MTAGAVQKSQWLYRRYRGVYTVVPPSVLSVNGRYLAAVLACGPAAALSHRSAADLHGLRKTNRAPIDVTVPGRTARRHDGIDLHRSTTLTPADVTIVDAIPVTTVARTVLDLAAVVHRRAVERALDQAAILEDFDLNALNDQPARNPHHPGAPALRAILATHTAGTTVTWSDLKELCLEVTRAAASNRLSSTPGSTRATASRPSAARGARALRRTADRSAEHPLRPCQSGRGVRSWASVRALHRSRPPGGGPGPGGVPESGTRSHRH
jgi:hypothetical protein